VTEIARGKGRDPTSRVVFLLKGAFFASRSYISLSESSALREKIRTGFPGVKDQDREKRAVRYLGGMKVRRKKSIKDKRNCTLGR